MFEASLLTPFIAEDLDSDGDIDIGVNGALLRNDGAGSFPSVIQASIPMESGRGVLRGDLENDGDTDVLIPGVGGTMRPHINQGQAVFVQGQRFNLAAALLSSSETSQCRVENWRSPAGPERPQNVQADL